MKNLKLFIVMLLACLTIATLASCSLGGIAGSLGGAFNPGSGSTEDDDDKRPAESYDPNKLDLIFNEAAEFQLIFADTDINADKKNELLSMLYEGVGTGFRYYNGVPETARKHEIIIGRSSRSVSVKAYEMLDRLMDEEDESKGGYVVYSDGSSLGVAYTEEYTDHIKNFVMDYLIDLCDTYELVAPRGILMQECIDLYEIYEKEDSEWRAQEWAQFETEMGSEITTAFKYLYNMYSPDVIEWLANLYEPRVCVCNNFDENGVRICQFPKDASGNYICKNGGFYYSNSGRNTVGYGIDIESTIQALGIIERAGLTREFGGNYVDALPDQIREDIIAFIKSCQDENGFFYHPQWTHEQVDSHLGRRGRDLMWAESLLKKFGANPFYDTAGGMKGEGEPEQQEPIVSPTAMTQHLGTSAIRAASKVVAAADPVADHLVSAETFKAYLESLPLNTQSYNIGNQLAAQSTQLVNRDKQLNGAISKVLFEWANSRQNSANGLWEPQINHSSVNGLFKILTFYNDFKEPFPYAYEAACSAIAVLASDEIPAHVCSLYNAWWCVGALLKNMEQFNKTYTPEQRQQIRSDVLAIAAQGLYDTRDSYEQFLKGGGAFSYTPNYSSSTSQGLPVAVPKTAEGDVNATEICLNGLRNHAVYALGVSVTPDLFGTLEMVKFLHIIENASPSIKDVTPEAEPMDFEYDELGVVPENVGGNITSTETGLLKSGGSILVSYAPDSRAGKVLHIKHLANPGNGDDIRINNVGNKLDTNCTVFDTDMYIASAGTSKSASVAQFTVGNLYLFYMQTTADGQIKLWEGSSFSIGKSHDRLLGVINMDEWFNIRVEYYNGDHDTVRIKIYLNGELLAVSSNYFSDSGEKFTLPEALRPEPPMQGDYFRFVGHSSFDMDLYLDNTLIACEKKTYKSEADTEGLLVNADKTGGERVTYTFDDGMIPEGVVINDTVGKLTVDNGALRLGSASGTSTVTIPTNVREGNGNVYSFGFDAALLSAAKAGDMFTVTFDVPYAQYNVKRSIELTFKVMQVGDTLALVGTNAGGKEAFTSAMIPLGGDSVSFEFAYFTDANIALVYANGIYVGSAETFVITSSYQPYHYDFSSITLTYKGSMEATLDNIFVEIRNGDYASEVQPNCDRVLHEFEGADEGEIETDGLTLNGVLSLSNGQHLTIPANVRVNFVSAYTLSATASFDNATNGKATRLELRNESGDVICALELVKKGGDVEVYEVASHGTLDKPVATFTANGAVAIALNYYTVDDVITLTVGDEVVLATTIFALDKPDDAVSATVTAYGVTLDDLYFEGMNNSYRTPTITTENPDSSADEITYEYSSTGSLPSRLTTSLKTGGGKAAIALMQQKDGTIGKVLHFATTSGDADQVNFQLSADGLTTANKLVFETDVMFDLAVLENGVNNYNFEIFFLGSKNETAYKNVFSQRKDGIVRMQDYSNNSGAIVGSSNVVCNAGEWVRLRIEIDMGDGTADTLQYRTYVDGILVGVSNNYWKSETGEPCGITEISKIRFSTYNVTIGSIYFDNTSIFAVDSFDVVE